MPRHSFGLLLLAAGFLVNHTHAAAPTYNVSVLQTPKGSDGQPQTSGFPDIRAVNNRGQIAGRWFVNGDTYEVLRWESTGVVKNYSRNAFNQFIGYGSALGINDNGVLIGLSGAGQFQSVVAYRETTTDTFSLFVNLVSGADINNAGMAIIQPAITADSYLVNTVNRQYTTLPRMIMSAINDVGAITGRSVPLGEAERAVIWTSVAGFTYLPTVDAPWAILPDDLNNRGTVVGNLYNRNDSWCRKPFVYDGELRELPLLPGFDCGMATGINENGMIVGSSFLSDRTMSKPVIWIDGVVYDLNSLTPSGFWDLRSALDISDTGYIAVTGSRDSRITGFLLTPLPEPSSLGMVAFVVVGLMRRTSKT